MFDYKKFGFIEDNDKSKMIGILKDKISLKHVSIDAYISSPYALILRSAEDSLEVDVQNERVIARRCGKDRTNVINVPMDCIDNVYFKFTEDCKCRMVFSVQNINYSVWAQVC